MGWKLAIDTRMRLASRGKGVNAGVRGSFAAAQCRKSQKSFELRLTVRVLITSLNDPRTNSESRTTIEPPVRAFAGDGAEHDEHDRHRAIHHYTRAHERFGWAASDAGLVRGAGDCDSRWNGMERTGRGDAGVRRL